MNVSHSLTKIWIHLIFGTKERKPLIKESFEKKLFEHIKRIIENDFKSLATAINGTSDHIHILMLQNQNYSIADIAKNVKGNSSHWINQNEFTNFKFAWQTGNGAFSVSESMIEDVKKYVLNQKEHHRKISFAEEYKKFEDKYGLVTGNRCPRDSYGETVSVLYLYLLHPQLKLWVNSRILKPRIYI